MAERNAQPALPLPHHHSDQGHPTLHVFYLWQLPFGQLRYSPCELIRLVYLGRPAEQNSS